MLRRITGNKLINRDEKKEEVFDKIFDNFIEEFLQPFNNKLEEKFSSFKVDVIETEDEFAIIADLPGFCKENVAIEYDNNYLTISAKKNKEENCTIGKYIRKERRCGEFRRSFLIDNVISSDIEATFEDGVLTVNLKKSKANNIKKIIQIK
ncbi:Hsp20/alpha crystallin family protein [Helicovermis profundi]|uniref:Hsp20/alpha crystallin family protein n=1 Tax=Helicovermis profundi TaxID=3065157 RepID=A0AAU9ES56_9FIRM|nr:Hsp20/alpha crystallin family protein [Clostridia bacterium S502]